MQRAYLSFGPLRLSYLEAGAQHPRKILILHANGYAAGCYDYIIHALSDRCHVCALDFAGHGESAGTLDFDSWDFFRDQIFCFLEHKGWPTCTAIGHSLGGGSVLRAAMRDSARFEKIIAFDPVMLGFLATAYTQVLGNPMARTAAGRRAVFKSKEQALKIFERHPANRRWQKEAVRAYAEYCIREKNGVAELCCNPKIESRIFSQVSYGHLFQLGKIRCPVRLVLPERSRVCPPWVARRITGGNPASGTDRLPGTGHLLPFEDRGQVLALLNRHL